MVGNSRPVGHDLNSQKSTGVGYAPRRTSHCLAIERNGFIPDLHPAFVKVLNRQKLFSEFFI